MKKIFTFLVAFLTTVSGAVWGQTGSADNPREINSSNINDFTDVDGKEIYLGDRNTPGVYYYTLNNVEYKVDASACQVRPNCIVHLKLEGTNTLQSGHNFPGIFVPVSSTLIIEGDGTLNAICQAAREEHANGAGIGGATEGSGMTADFGTIIITGGTVNARCNGAAGVSAHANAAGLGGGAGSTQGTIIITGGTVNATCYDNDGYVQKQALGAGIGGGEGGTCTSITILGGNVTASVEGDNCGFTIGLGQNNDEGHDGPAIILGSWDESTTPTITEKGNDGYGLSQTEYFPNYLDVRGGTPATQKGTVTMPENTQMVLKADPTSTLNAYKVVYNSNLPEGATISGGSMPTATMAYGPSTSYALATVSNLTATVNSYPYQVVSSHWLNNSNAWVAAGKDETTSASVPSGLSTIPYGAAWVLKEASLEFNDDAGFAVPLNVYGPEGASFDIKATDNDTYTSLEDLGLQISGRQLKKADSYSTVTAGDYKIQLNFTPKDQTATALQGIINVKVNDTPDDASNLVISAATTEGNVLTYNGTILNKGTDGKYINDKAIAITKKDGTTVSTSLFDVEYSLTGTDGSWSKDLKNAGKYYVRITSITGAFDKDPNTTTEAIVEVKKADVTVTSVETATYDMNTGTELSDYSDTKIEFSGIIESEKETILALLSWTGRVDGTAALTAGTYEDAVTYTIKVAEKNAEAAANYNLPIEAKGDLIVKKTGDGNDPINPGNPTDPDTEIKINDGEGGWEWSENGYTRVYDGEKHSLKADNLVYVRQKGGENEWVAVPASAITVTSVSPEGDIKNQGTYTVKLSIVEAKDILYSGTVGDITLVITPRPMVIDINKLTVEDVAGITGATPIDITTDDVTFKAVEGKEESGIVEKEKEDAVVVGTITVTPAESTEEGKKTYSITVEEDNFTLDGVDGGEFVETNYTATYTYNGKSIEDEIEETIGDITPGNDTYIDDGDGDESNWEWDTDENAYVLIYDGNEHGIESIIVSGVEATEIKVTYSDEEGVELGKDELPLDAGHYTAEVIVTVEGTSKTGTIPLWIKQRPLGVHFNLDDYILEAGGEYDAIDVAEYEPVEVEENVWVGGELKSEEPVLEGKIKVADTPNSEDKYAVTFEGVKLGTEGNFDADNYKPKYYLNGELIELGENGNGTFGGDNDPEQGIDISEPDDETGISGIGTKRYRLYLANKDYNVVDAKADYAAEGLELFSRHDKKYTKAGGSFTVWYEKDGVANAGGYRIFWSNRANGEYKEVKFDTVSEYFQIRNVQSDVYVKIYAADGFPVGNEEISAADYRAYAQPNKIVVITPQPTDVQIISMAGAVVATDKVTGQREFANLTEGVYIVRMGETVVKLQVRK